MQEAVLLAMAGSEGVSDEDLTEAVPEKLRGKGGQNARKAIGNLIALGLLVETRSYVLTEEGQQIADSLKAIRDKFPRRGARAHHRNET